MPDWTKSMQQTFEYYIVNPNSWMDEKPLKFVKSSSIDRDEDTDTLGSMTIDMDENIGEAWIRVYLVTIQNGVTERHPLGTFLVQTPSMETDGKTKEYSADAYTPLIILKEKLPDLGYYIEKESNILEQAYLKTNENIKPVPVVKTSCGDTLVKNFVADPENNWFEFISDLLANAEYRFGLDEMGRVLFLPKQELDALQPVWTFDDGNSSILYPDLTFEDDFYGIPNVVQVTCSSSSGGAIFTATEENKEPNSPVSIQNRGRRIYHRDTNPKIIGVATQEKVDEYAKKLLKELSTIERRITFKHGYCPVRIGDAVRLNYERAGINNVKAKVVSQSIECVPGCPVSTTVVYTSKLWR